MWNVYTAVDGSCNTVLSSKVSNTMSFMIQLHLTRIKNPHVQNNTHFIRRGANVYRYKDCHQPDENRCFDWNGRLSDGGEGSQKNG